MMKLPMLGAAAILATALATPALSQEATQEPGMIGFNYPNSNYLRGGYGVRLPSRYDRITGAITGRACITVRAITVQAMSAARSVWLPV